MSDDATKTETVNAVIESTRILYERDFILTVQIGLDYGGTGQGFGGYVLGGKPGSKASCESGNDKGYLTSWVNGVMLCAGVDDFSKASGKVVRVQREAGWNGKVLAIGHAVKDIWFNPSEEFARLKGQVTEATDV